MPIRDRALHDAAVRVALELVAVEGLDRGTLTEVARRLRLPGGERVSERTLRRKYGSTARLLFGTPWWLPEPADAVRVVLAPRPIGAEGPVWPSGPAAEAASAVVDDCRCEDGVPARDPRDRPAGCDCEDGRTDDTWPDAAFFTDAGIDDPLGDLAHASPEPVALRDLLHDLHIVLSGHLLASGWAANLPWIDALRADRREVAAWLALAEGTWAHSLGRTVARVFALDAAGGSRRGGRLRRGGAGARTARRRTRRRSLPRRARSRTCRGRPARGGRPRRGPRPRVRRARYRRVRSGQNPRVARPEHRPARRHGRPPPEPGTARGGRLGRYGMKRYPIPGSVTK
ncbi:hypothetical protein TSOC111612_15960 [Tsukamurella ocularis]|uniref:hypothetical protein n=1 Tax=Tsukamurella ocularis TaxID=1970234 RepID=UPI0039F01939